MKAIKERPAWGVVACAIFVNVGMVFTIFFVSALPPLVHCELNSVEGKIVDVEYVGRYGQTTVITFDDGRVQPMGYADGLRLGDAYRFEWGCNGNMVTVTRLG